MAYQIDYTKFASNPFCTETKGGYSGYSPCERREGECSTAPIAKAPCDHCGRKVRVDLDECPGCGAPTE
jgi:hypothetical protein